MLRPQSPLGWPLRPVVLSSASLYNGRSAMRLVFMGTSVVVIPCLEALLQAGHEMLGVFCPPDRPVGRHGRVESPPVKAYALSRGLPIYQPPSLRRPHVQEELAILRPEVIVVAAYGKFLPAPILGLPPLGCLNLHPSLLPRHRGPSPVVTALLEGDTLTGVSIILLDSGMDTGPILAQREEPILPQDTAATLTQRLFQQGAELLVDTLEQWAGRRLSPTPQNEGQATVTRMVRKEDGRVDWGLPAQRVARMVRAYEPWPGVYTRWQGRLLKLLEVMPQPKPASGEVVGSVRPWNAQGAAIVTGEGLLELRRLQLEGRRPLSIDEFLRGSHDFLGSRLPS